MLFLLPAAHAAEPAPTNKPVVWSYDDDYTGQEEWGWIIPAWAACGKGTQQSPIVISHTQEKSAPPPVFFYEKSGTSVRNIGYTLEIAFDSPQLYYAEGGKRYRLRRIHFHTPSEHIIRKDFYLAEIQLMHEAEDGEQLIVAVFADIAVPLAGLDKVLAAVPTQRKEAVKIDFNPLVLIPQYAGHYAYVGSLTTPPCTEGIKWRIMKRRISISKEQMDALSQFTRRNARLPQPVYMRTVEEVN